MKFSIGKLVELRPTIGSYDRFKCTFPWRIIGASNPGGNHCKIVYKIQTAGMMVFSDIPEEDLKKWEGN